MKIEHQQRREEMIDLMAAGRRTDALIAERVMGFIVRKGDGVDFADWYSGKQPGTEPHWSNYQEVPLYSTEMAAVWEVVEKMNPVHPLIMTFRPIEKDWWVVLPNEAKHPKGKLQHGPDCMVEAFAETAPLAICRAALKTCD